MGKQALKYLKDITNEEFPCQAVREGDSLDLGGKTLQFIGASNLHWPDRRTAREKGKRQDGFR